MVTRTSDPFAFFITVVLSLFYINNYFYLV